MRTRHRKNISSYMNITKHVKYTDETIKTTIKHYKKLLSSNHYQIIMWRASTTDTYYRLHATVNIA